MQQCIPPAVQPSPDKREVTSEVKDQSGEHSQQVRNGRSRAELRDIYSRAQAGTWCSDLSLTGAPGNRGRGVCMVVCASLRGGQGKLVGAIKARACIQGPEGKNSQEFLPSENKIISQLLLVTPCR